LLPVGAEHIRPQGKEQLFEAAAILDALAQEGNQVLGDVHATAALVLGKGENPGGVFVASGASEAVLSDAGFLDQSQRPFEWGPESGESSQEVLLQGQERIGTAFHMVCI